MKTLLLIALILISTQSIGQTSNLDSLIDVGIAYYKDNKKSEALKVWEYIESSAAPTSSTYGTTLLNILYFFSKERNEPKLLEYYEKVINSKLNDKDRSSNGLSEIYKNYRYKATITMAGYYASEKKFQTALSYFNIADEKIVYEETSLTSIIIEKIKLSNWKSRAYTDLGKTDSAFYILLKRALEYDYKNMYKNWATLSQNNSELNLAKAIIKFDSSKSALLHFKSELDDSFDKLNLKEINGSFFLSFKFRGLSYDIIVYEKMSDIEAYKTYLKSSVFYTHLTNSISQ